jgi:hypothetical protein
MAILNTHSLAYQICYSSLRCTATIQALLVACCREEDRTCLGRVLVKPMQDVVVVHRPAHSPTACLKHIHDACK